MTKCIFCDIVKGAAPASVAHHDKTATAFMDIQPINPGHVLIIPNTHAACLSELEEVREHLFRIAMRIAVASKRTGIRCEGVNLFLADGKAASQEIFHVHLHVIPRFREDGFGLRFGPNYGFRPSRDELDNIAIKIKEIIHSQNVNPKKRN